MRQRVVLFVALALALVAVLGACTGDANTATATDGSSTSDAPTSDPVTSEAAMPESTTDPAAGSDPSPDSPESRLSVNDDGTFPWIFPEPVLSWFEEGCPSQEDVLINFMANYFGESDPKLTSLSATTSADERRWVVHNRGEGGDALDSGTVITMAMLDLDLELVSCEAWGIVSARSDRTVIDGAQIVAGAADEAVIEVTGQGDGFERVVDLRVHDESLRSVAEGFAMGGFAEPEPFTGQVRFTAEPIGPNLVAIATGSNPADGATSTFSAFKVPCCADDGPPIVLPVVQNGPPFAVVDVAADDVLNVRIGPGVESPIATTLSPFTVGMQILDDDPVTVGDDTWVRVADVGGEGVEGWVNDRFISALAGEVDVPASLFVAVFDVREALALNSPGARLTDVLAGQGAASIIIDDQEVPLDDIDGRQTIADFGRSALAVTDRVAVNLQTTDSDTFANLVERHPGATIVAFHNDGLDGTSDLTWSSVWLAFEPVDVGHRLVAIAAGG